MLRLAIVILAATGPEPRADRVEHPIVPVPAACTARFERARDELINGGFAPTGDKDTARWLHVTNPSPAIVVLDLEMRTSADGPATFYRLSVRRSGSKGGAPERWRRRTRAYCCDEHATAEDRLIEHRWTRASGRLAAEVSVVEFEATRRDPDVVRWRDTFVAVGRAAADDCMAAARLVP